MRFDSIKMEGELILEMVDSLPEWDSSYQGRLVQLLSSPNTLYFGGENGWRQLSIDLPDDSDDVFVAYDGESFYLTSPLPDQTNNGGKVLQTNGSNVTWYRITESDILPDQTGQTGKFLRTDGNRSRWASVPSDLPPQGGNSGKVLSTDGKDPSWTDISESMGLPGKQGHAEEFLQVSSDESEVLWNSVLPLNDTGSEQVLANDGNSTYWKDETVADTDILPDQRYQDGNILATNGAYPYWTNAQNVLDLSQPIISEDTIIRIPSDFSDLNQAMNHLKDYAILDTARVEILIDSGTYNWSTPVRITHSNGKNIFIVGNGSSSTVLDFDTSQWSMPESAITIKQSHIGKITGLTIKTATVGSDENRMYGISVWESSSAILEDVVIDGFGQGLYALNSSYVNTNHDLVVKNCNYVGVRARSNSIIACPKSTSENNFRGFLADVGGTVIANNSTSSDSEYGFTAWRNAMMSAVYSTSTAYRSFTAYEFSYLDAYGASGVKFQANSGAFIRAANVSYQILQPEPNQLSDEGAFIQLYNATQEAIEDQYIR